MHVSLVGLQLSGHVHCSAATVLLVRNCTWRGGWPNPRNLTALRLNGSEAELQDVRFLSLEAGALRVDGGYALLLSCQFSLASSASCSTRRKVSLPALIMRRFAARLGERRGESPEEWLWCPVALVVASATSEWRCSLPALPLSLRMARARSACGDAV